MGDILQWHPAFFAGIQIELEEESDNLLFENEHQLGTRPKAIDVLITKKDKRIPVKKNIGRIFRKYNIIEYKGPQDYISIDDFYKVYAYACLYKSDAVGTNHIRITDITVTFVCKKHPKSLFGHLKAMHKYEIEKIESGIYLLYGDVFPIQIIVTKELSAKENLWLHSLTDEIKSKREAEELVRIYEKHQKNTLYESVMDVIVKANHEKFKEVSSMCQALVEIMQPYIDEQVELRVKEQVEKAEEKAEVRAEEKIIRLTRMLLAAGRMEDLNRAIDDGEYRSRLCEELALS
ncbi:MAG: 3-isopropylmalate dehydrogenase [Lachnospiraceae bacterium]|nr:3-isopropylmalate dehydrogenase [Lachnospiraceae bacterium]